jgi:hypothetical protein
MTSYIPQTKFAGMPDRWFGAYRYETRAEAEDNLASIRARREDLIDMRIVESPHKPSGAYRNKKPWLNTR